MVVVHLVVRALFCCLIPDSHLLPGEVQFQLQSLSRLLQISRSILGFLLIAAIALVSLIFLSVFIDILKMFSIFSI